MTVTRRGMLRAMSVRDGRTSAPVAATAAHGTTAASLSARVTRAPPGLAIRTPSGAVAKTRRGKVASAATAGNRATSTAARAEATIATAAFAIAAGNVRAAADIRRA